MLNCNKNKCTCWFDRILNKDWTHCCAAHDRDYILNPYGRTKEVADNSFYDCLKQSTWSWMATAMYWAVKYTPMAHSYWKQYRLRGQDDD